MSDPLLHQKPIFTHTLFFDFRHFSCKNGPLLYHFVELSFLNRFPDHHHHVHGPDDQHDPLLHPLHEHDPYHASFGAHHIHLNALHHLSPNFEGMAPGNEKQIVQEKNIKPKFPMIFAKFLYFLVRLIIRDTRLSEKIL